MMKDNPNHKDTEGEQMDNFFRKEQARLSDDLEMISEQPKEMVNHPDHYTWHPTGIECVEVIEEFPANIAMGMRYLWRAEHKGKKIQDLRKAIQCIEFEIERAERKLKDA